MSTLDPVIHAALGTASQPAPSGQPAAQSAPAAAPAAIDYQALARALVVEARAGAAAPAAPTQQTQQPAPQTADPLAAALTALAGTTGEKPRYVSPGTPNGAPSEYFAPDLSKLGRDAIERLRSEPARSGDPRRSRFIEECERYRDSLPGGANTAPFGRRGR